MSAAWQDRSHDLDSLDKLRALYPPPEAPATLTMYQAKGGGI